MMNAVLLLVTALSLAAPTDPCQQNPTLWDGQSFSQELSGAPLDWTTRALDWENLRTRFEAIEQRTLLSGTAIRIDAILGIDEVVFVVGRRLKGPWCATSVWHEYFGGKGLDVNTIQVVSVADSYLLFLDGTGNYSSPPGARERILKLAKVSGDGSMDQPADVTVKVGPSDSVEVAQGSNGEARLLARGTSLVDVYRVGPGTNVSLAYRLPGMGSSPDQSKALLTTVCRKEPRTRAKHAWGNFVSLPQVFEGKLVSLGTLRHPTEDDMGIVLELTFTVSTVFRDVGSLLTKGERHTVVVPVSSRLAKDILLANDSPGSLPAVCLDRLGLPDALKPGGRYLVAAHDTWEGEQAALPPTKSSKTTRKAFERLAREAAFVDQFKDEFIPTDSFTIDDQGETFEIVVQHASAGDATGGAEQYVLDKKTGKWKMGWHEHPQPK